MNRERYRHGAHTVTELKYHFVWKTKDSYPVLRGEMGLRLRHMLREVGVEQKMTRLFLRFSLLKPRAESWMGSQLFEGLRLVR